jgi:outer membrane protein, heavy metal efflux system
MIRCIKAFSLWFLVPTMVLLPLLTGGVQAAEGLSELVALALANNPEIKAAEERLGMTEEKAKQVGTLEDPMLMVKIQNGLLNNPLAFDRDTTTAKVIGITQALPFYGKRDLRRQGAGFDVLADRLRIEESRLSLQRMVKETWYRISAVDRSLEALEKTIGALNDLLRFSETMYGVGKGLQQDVLKAQLERSKMEEMRLNLEQRRRSLTATLNTLAYRPVQAALPAIPAAVIVPLQLTQEGLETLADAHRPLLKAQAALIEKSLVGRRLAEREIYPDFNISLEYMQREQSVDSEGDDMYSAAISFNLPVQHERRRAMIAEAGAENRMLLLEHNMLRNQIRLALADSLSALERNQRLAALYKNGILGQAASVLETTIAAYQAGKTDFMKVLDSQMAIFNLEREYHEAVAEYHMQVAALEALVGTELPGIPE